MLSLIVAVAKNNAIGKNNDLLVKIPADLKRFKAITLNKTIIMGRKTFESLPGLLPKRKHVVITNDSSFKVDGVEIRYNLQDAIREFATSSNEVFVIGGASVYEQALPFAEKLYLTIIDKEFPDADRFFPKLDESSWELSDISEVLDCNDTSVKFYFKTLVRRGSGSLQGGMLHVN